MYLILVVLLLMLFHSMGWAQQEVNYNLYQYHLNLINPATTGTQGAPFLNMSLRTQWVGLKDAPETQAISYGNPHSNNRLGTGFSIINDRTFIENQTQLFVDFSYRLQLDNNEQNLFLGLKAGGTSIRLKAQNLETHGSSVEDPLLHDTTSFIPNIGVGVFYKVDRFFLSVSIPRLLQTERYRRENEQATFATDRPHLFISSGYRIPLTSNWDFKPAVLFSYVDAAPIDLLMDASFSYQKKSDFGIQYSLSGGVGGIASLKVSEGFQVGYAYVTSTLDQINRFSYGTHEIVLKIRLNDGGVNFSRKASFTTELEDQSLPSEKKVGVRNRNNKPKK